jgi:hypothetical protein
MSTFLLSLRPGCHCAPPGVQLESFVTRGECLVVDPAGPHARIVFPPPPLAVGYFIAEFVSFVSCLSVSGH